MVLFGPAMISQVDTGDFTGLWAASTGRNNKLSSTAVTVSYVADPQDSD